jgi:hypothetical protein
MYRPMTQQEMDDWDEREEMLVRGLVKEKEEEQEDGKESNLCSSPTRWEP